MSAKLLEADLYADLFGFVLCAPAELDAYHGGSARGMDLLAADDRTGDATARAATGSLVVLLGLDPETYTLTVRERDNTTDQTHHCPGGLRVHAVDGRLCLCSLGHLQRWDPEQPGVCCFRVAPGWYEVETHEGPTAAPSPAAPKAIELVLRRVAPSSRDRD